LIGSSKKAGDGFSWPERTELMAAMGVVRCDAGILGEDRPLVALTADQHPAGDLARELSRNYSALDSRALRGGMITISRPALARPTLASNQ
jgi:hypothetical protein